MISLGVHYFGKRTLWSLLYFLNYCYYDILPSLKFIASPLMFRLFFGIIMDFIVCFRYLLTFRYIKCEGQNQWGKFIDVFAFQPATCPAPHRFFNLPLALSSDLLLLQKENWWENICEKICSGNFLDATSSINQKKLPKKEHILMRRISL